MAEEKSYRNVMEGRVSYHDSVTEGRIKYVSSKIFD